MAGVPGVSKSDEIAAQPGSRCLLCDTNHSVSFVWVDIAPFDARRMLAVSFNSVFDAKVFNMHRVRSSLCDWSFVT